jgi:hypothetical protein
MTRTALSCIWVNLSPRPLHGRYMLTETLTTNILDPLFLQVSTSLSFLCHRPEYAQGLIAHSSLFGWAINSLSEIRMKETCWSLRVQSSLTAGKPQYKSIQLAILQNLIGQIFATIVVCSQCLVEEILHQLSAYSPWPRNH